MEKDNESVLMERRAYGNIHIWFKILYVGGSGDSGIVRAEMEVKEGYYAIVFVKSCRLNEYGMDEGSIWQRL